MVGQGWLIVQELGGKASDLGVLGAATAIPAILINLFGGALADRLDRRKILIATTSATTILMAALAALDLSGSVQIWHVQLIAALNGVSFGFDWPTRNAFFPQLIKRDHMVSAVTLNTIVWQGSRVIIPAVAGVMIRYSGTASLFLASAAGYAVMLLVLITLSSSPVPPRPKRHVLKDMAEGFSFITRSPLFRVIILLTYANMFFGFQVLQLMPLFAQRFDASAEQFGWMFSAMGVGAVLGTVAASRVQNSRFMGRALLAGTFVFTLFLVAFAFAPAYGATLPLLFCASFFNAVFLISSMTALQLQVPDSLRGRVMGIHSITFSLIPLGGLLGGGVATLTDERWAVAGSALALTAILVFVAVTQRHIRELDGSRLRESRPVAPETSPPRPGVTGA
jgi:MFS family permease